VSTVWATGVVDGVAVGTGAALAVATAADGCSTVEGAAVGTVVSGLLPLSEGAGVDGSGATDAEGVGVGVGVGAT
jgi:hypothetical protein